ncbi:hypothetical protein BH24CHL4_BH24CHL4_25840 [soil metagenome]
MSNRHLGVGPRRVPGTDLGIENDGGRSDVGIGTTGMARSPSITTEVDGGERTSQVSPSVVRSRSAERQRW